MDSDGGNAARRRGRATAHAASIAPGMHEIEIAGPLAPGWAGRLAAGLAQRAVSIERGHALADGCGGWAARFEVKTPFALDAALVERILDEPEEDAARYAITLAACDVRAVPEHGGALLVAVRARDCTGFLATLLRRFAFFSLFAVEVQLETRDGIADDRFWLRAGGHRQPAPATGPALRASLRSLVTEPTHDSA
jgi:hypothetical protein